MLFVNILQSILRLKLFIYLGVDRRDQSSISGNKWHPFVYFFAEIEYRLMVSREKVNTYQIDIFKGNNFVYRSIQSKKQTKYRAINY